MLRPPLRRPGAQVPVQRSLRLLQAEPRDERPDQRGPGQQQLPEPGLVGQVAQELESRVGQRRVGRDARGIGGESPLPCARGLKFRRRRRRR
ncbi:MAG TPA: hypothetical protein VGI96_48285 [Streptosporangiaceae bacterium]